MDCIVCKKPMAARVSSWTFYCPVCDYWSSDLIPRIDLDDAIFAEQESNNVIHFLNELRVDNFNAILSRCKALGLSNGTLLEVGCAGGLFLRCAHNQGFDAEGIEPKKEMAAPALADGLKVRAGFFPDVLAPTEAYSAIFFNDVLEHIPDLRGILRGCFQHLHSKGLLVINLPNSRGFFYRLATVMARLGITQPYERLWQKMFFTPHLHYFSETSLIQFAKQHGFESISKPLAIKTIKLKGLWKRLSIDYSSSLPYRLIMFAGIVCATPFIHSGPPDSIVLFFQRKNE